MTYVVLVDLGPAYVGSQAIGPRTLEGNVLRQWLQGVRYEIRGLALSRTRLCLNTCARARVERGKEMKKERKKERTNEINE